MGQTKYSKAEINALMGASIQHHQSGNFAEAESLYRQVLDASPGNFDALHLLGVLAHQAGFHEDAVKYIGKAVRIDKKSPTAFNHLGAAHRALGQLHEAVHCYRSALRLKSDFAEAHYNLANTLGDLKQFRESVAEYKKAVKLKPDYAEAYCNLGAVQVALGMLEEDESVAHEILKEAGKSCLYALSLKPDYTIAYYNLGSSMDAIEQFEDAVIAYRNALLLKPDYAEAFNNLGISLSKLGNSDEALSAYRKVMELQPDRAEVIGTLLCEMNYCSFQDMSDPFEYACRYGQVVDLKVGKLFSSWKCSPQTVRLKVGMVSGDFRDHPVGYFIEGFLPYIDKQCIELIAYSTSSIESELTSRIRPCFSIWKSLVGLTDEAAANMIHADGIHVLLDLSGHTDKNRLSMFAWKPAPVQTTWLGYSRTTGVAQIDYILGDSHVTPVGEQGQYIEKIWQMPESYLCFAPPDLAVEVGPLPALSTGGITFCSFNNLKKINDDVIGLWSRVLLATPGSRLFLRAKQLKVPFVLEKIVNRFAENGVKSDRLILDSVFTSRAELFEAYNRVDIALDPFPYNGTTTTVESLWMGVPVIALQGNCFLSHVGESILHNTGSSEWIAEDEDDYVAKAVCYSSDLEALSSLRAGLRQQVLASPVFDAPRFARHFEEALWGMWREWKGKN